MSDTRLNALRDIMQEDVGQRGLATDPECNLLTECRDDFRTACHSIAGNANAAVAIVTGFIIPRAEPPAGETDGPLGALFLARALAPLGIRVAVFTDLFCKAAFEAALHACNLHKEVALHILPPKRHPWDVYLSTHWPHFHTNFRLTHLIGLERPGPSHTPNSLRAQGLSAETPGVATVLPSDHHDRYHTMRGMDITEMMSPAHLLFENLTPGVVSIGIGDGGNEIGMGKIRWDIVQRNIPNGGLVACRIATQHLLVAGVSNWGAYALAAGVRLLRGHEPKQAGNLFDIVEEERLLQLMVKEGPLVDGVSAKPTATVDGLAFADYARKLQQMAAV